ncbi:hypothetical protein [Pseudoalteromonas luteoviolacea]|uniref:Solute-binding protein family 3/N-terminal domain-containing protein n=1 Tax=Pseudoalteromonas luteoviolacea S4054 TaxID=1129367 RepID=A0A0F6A8C0_9GAMM|nr:hypothetical protein [Pseudoalteromonas luteoviolacea]AOT09321.1 hypothetical protein S4054249_16355 [Pseudoalteromonas luteoviolacea]AOT14233.1 hypothetical protein S40542_16325 [Pseudoalteromonas luteoviolacea]AOT19149.1 hypothetical protein S4054_16330 [Pseudoalteromonas luteoviolacea]KKE82106.1 hypothetical protein N479_19925 [Pseudoalteromonas luteoviolacea S4054]KZN73426.1 hypothetical protein N481_11920 [Pseudoalteromonas luteoviolacea S4047-1]
MKWLIWVWLSLCSGSLSAHNQLVVDIMSSENFSQRYTEFLNGRSPLDVKSFYPTTKGSHIEIIEMVLLQQALFLGGETREVVFNPKPSVNIIEFSDMISGESLVLARSVWHEDIINYRGSLYVSDAVVEFGQYEAGLYVTKRNVALQNLPQEQLEQLTVVANPRWRVDWRALNNTDINIVSFIGPWETMLNMVETEVVDAMLINFSVSQDLLLNFEGREYVPIQNIKMMLPDSRHFIVSKNHPQGEMIFAALNRGLKILRAQGVLDKALQQSGFISHLVEDWRYVNQQMLHPIQGAP